MSAEQWGPVAKLRIRFVPCAHAYKHADVYKKSTSAATCPICCVEQGLNEAMPETRDYVPNSDLTWGGAVRREVHQFDSDSQGDGSSLRDLAADMSRRCGGVHEIDLQGNSAENDMPDGETDTMAVVRASPAGCFVKSGVIRVPRNGVLLLDGHGAHFADIRFVGGAVVCAGPQFSGTFTRCQFHCTVCVVHGAAATFSNCRFVAFFGLIASGGAAVATLSGCEVHDCVISVIAEAGAVVRAGSTRIHRAEAGIVSNDPGTVVSLTCCVLRGGGPAWEEERDGVLGVMARGGAVSLRDCKVLNFNVALTAAGATACVEAQRVRVKRAGHAVIVHAHARATLRHLDINLSPPDGSLHALFAKAAPIALTVGGEAANTHRVGGRVQLEHCSVFGETASGLQVFQGGALCAVRCNVEVHEEPVCVRSRKAAAPAGRAVLRHSPVSAAQQGCTVDGEGSLLWLEGCQVIAASMEEVTSAVEVHSGGRLAAADCLMFSEGYRAGCCTVDVRPKSSAALLRCDLTTSAGGVQCFGAVTAKDCAVQNNTMPLFGSPEIVPSAYMAVKSVLRVEGGSSTGANVAVFLTEGAEAHVSGVTMSGCAQAVRTMDGATATVIGCHVSGGFKCDDNVKRTDETQNYASIVLKGRGGSVEGCKLTGFYRGVHVDASGSVEVRDCDISQVPSGGAGVLCMSDVVVENCRFTASRPGVVAERGSVAVRGCEFGSGLRCGVDVPGPAEVSVVNSRFNECTVGMAAGRRATLAAQDCRCDKCDFGIRAEPGGYTVTAKRLTVAGAGRMGLIATAGPTQRGSVKVVDSSVSGPNLGVNFVGRGVSGSLLRCEVEGCTLGVCVSEAALARMRNVRVRGGDEGVTVGDMHNRLGLRCAVCGREGPAAHAAAWAAVRGARELGDPKLRPRCIHEGGRAVVTMEDCDVRGCAERGVHVQTHGHLTATRVHTAECGMGFAEVALGARSVYTDCTAAVFEGGNPAAAFLQGPMDAFTDARPMPLQGVRVVR